MPTTMQMITLASRPTGAPTHDNFSLDEAPLPEPGAGEVLVRVHYMSLDPYMRGRMNAGKSYAKPVEIGGTMEGGGVGEVLSSNDPAFSAGDMVVGAFGWATHAAIPAGEIRKLPDGVPPTAALGVLGMPGFTGWVGLNEFGRPAAGETLAVAAATGPVGSMVGQLAKARGLRTIGIAGGADKCAQAVELFGFDACLDHRAHAEADTFATALSQAAPDGIDIYFENVGGKVLEAVLPNMNNFGRIPLCGTIAWYNTSDATLTAPTIWRTILVKFLSVNGFIIFNHWDQYPAFLNEVAPLVAAGKIRYLEDIVEGLENAPEAFMGLLQGRNMGKLVVKLI